MFRKKQEPKSPTATLTIIQDADPETIHINLQFDPPGREDVKDPMAYTALLIGYQAVLTAIQPHEPEEQPEEEPSQP